MIAGMAKLPIYGWFHVCAHCEKITSRVMEIRSRRKRTVGYVCQMCRANVMDELVNEFRYVRVKEDTIAKMVVVVVK